VVPDVLRWARESASLEQVAVARKLKVDDDRVAAWENGDESPTVAQLRKLAPIYKRSLAVFFLAQPPEGFDTMRDFRRHPDVGAGEWSPELHGEYRRALAQRECAIELADLDDNPPSTAWKIDGAGDDDLAAKARERLLGACPVPTPSASSSAFDHLNAWTASLEEVGVLVMTTSGGGVSTKEMRAFSLYFEDYPVVMLNGGDGPRPRLFSALHEYAHLLLHTSGLCDTVADTRATSPDRRLEARCNAIAAAVLMPASAIYGDPTRYGRPENEWNYATLREAATPFGVSAEALLRRLTTLGLVTEDFYKARRAEFVAEFETEERRGRESSGGDFYRSTARNLGKGYVRRVTDAHERRVIDSYTAATFLDVKANQLAKLADAASLRNAIR
jgi:Zn-dependent peptidase ImmA (M78 family)